MNPRLRAILAAEYTKLALEFYAEALMKADAARVLLRAVERMDTPDIADAEKIATEAQEFLRKHQEDSGS